MLKTGMGFTHLFSRLLRCYSRLSRGYILAHRIYNLCAGLMAFANLLFLFEFIMRQMKHQDVWKKYINTL